MTNTSPVPTINGYDVEKLAADMGPGIYPAARMYARYCELMKAEGREPVNPTKFGRALSLSGCQRKKVSDNGRKVAAWLI